MVSTSTSTQQLSIPLDSEVIAHTFLGNPTYILEPPIEEEKAIMWTSQVFISFFISDIVRTFLGPFHGSLEKPE